MKTPRVTEDDFSQCLLLNTIKAARALSRRYDEKLKPFGVTVAQFSVMMVVRHNEGKSINAIAGRIAMDRSTLSRNVDLLADKGLLIKEDLDSGNAKTCRLTKSGKDLLEKLIPKWIAVREEMRTLLDGRDPSEYLAILKTFADG